MLPFASKNTIHCKNIQRYSTYVPLSFPFTCKKAMNTVYNKLLLYFVDERLKVLVEIDEII
jgi:hypothetical protein